MPRQREPVDLLTYKGNKNLTKEEIAERKAQEVKAPSDKVRPPTYLPRDLKREFKKIASDLVEIGIMTNLDNDALARFLMAKKMYLEVTDKLLSISPTIEVPNFKKDSNGDVYEDGTKEVMNDMHSELLISQDKLFKQCRSAASDLGLTIASRCRLVVPKKTDDKPKNKFSKFAK